MNKWIKKSFAVSFFVVGLFSLLTGQGTAQPFKTLHNFSGGGVPQNGVALSGKTLYGTTAVTSGNGTVFKVDIDGTSFATLHSFTGADGTYSKGWLIVSGTRLFGTTVGGSSLGLGTLFAVNTDGNGRT
jgi:uncharacterized repeat protein (TIGR03803 family)